MNSANAEAKASGLIESAKQKQAIVRAEQQQRAVEAEIHLDIMDKEVGGRRVVCVGWVGYSSSSLSLSLSIYIHIHIFLSLSVSLPNLASSHVIYTYN